MVLLALTGVAFAQSNLGNNPVVLAGNSLSLGSLDIFSGTLTIGVAGQNNGTLFLATDYTTGLAIVFTGSDTRLNHPGVVRTLTITTGGSITRTGAGSTTFFENVTNGGTLTVNGGTLTSTAPLLTNQAGGSIVVTGTTSVLNLVNFSNTGTLTADNSGQIRFTGNITTTALGNASKITLANNGVIEFASGATLTNTASNLAAPNGGSYLFNGTIVGGTIDANALTQSAGTLDGAVISGDLTVGAGKSLTLKNGGGWTGNATVGTSGQSNGFLFLATDNTLSGGLLLTGSGSQLTHSNSVHTLTVAASGAIKRTGAGSSTVFENLTNSGLLKVDGGTLTLSSTLTNQPSGSVVVTGSGSILNLTSFANAGTFNADSGGQLRFTGNFTTANLGSSSSISITNGGVIELASNGVLTNTSATLAAPVGGSYLFNGTIVGGTINANALTQSAGTLDGAVISGDLTVGAGKSLTLQNGGGWTGNATVGTSGQSNGFLFLATDNILSGGLLLTGSGSQLTHSNSVHTLTVAATGSIKRTGAGSSTVFENLTNSGLLKVDGGTLTLSSALTNQPGGSVVVTGSGSILNLTTFANAGTFNADSGGQLRFTGNFTTANLGSSSSISITNGGVIELASNGVLTNTAANLTGPVGGSYLFNGTIIGGTIDANALTQSAGTLDGAIISGNVAVPAGTSLTLKNNGGWTGSATVGTTGQSNGFLFLGTDVTLPSALTFTGSGSQLTHSNSTHTLTVTGTGSITRSGLGSSSWFENIVNSGSIVVNGGTVFSSGTLTNQSGGILTVSNGATLTQSGTFTNLIGAATTVTGSGSKLSIANVSNSGALAADASGSLSLTGNFATGGIGNITLTGNGTVEIANSGTLNNASANLSGPNGGNASFIFNGTISGGTIDAGALTQSAGTLDNGAVIMGNVSVPAGTSLTLKNGSGWSGTATIGTAGQNNGFLLLGTDATLPTAVVFTGNNSQLSHTNSARTVTITSTGSATRTGAGSTSSFENILNSGSIVVNGGTLFSSGTLTNQSGGTLTVSNGATLSQSGTFTNLARGTATVTGSGSKLIIANVTNTGALVADSSGLLQLTGNFTTTGLGNITLTNNGTAELASTATLNNASANLSGPNAGNGSYLFNGTISGGTIDATALTQSSGTLDNGAVILGNVAVPAGTSLTLKNNSGWSGTATIGTAGENNGFLLLGTDATLATAVVFTGNNSQLSHTNSARTVTIASSGSATRTGAGSTSSFENILNSGSIVVDGGTLFSSGTLTNQNGGTLLVSNGAVLSQTGSFTNQSGASAVVTGSGSKLAVANLSNAGTLVSDTSALLSLTGNFTTAGLGTITLTHGGTVELASASTLNNASANLSGPNGGNASYIFNGTIVGGTIDAAALAQSAGTLDNATITGDVSVPAGTSLTLKNGGGWTGNATVGTAGQNNGFLILASDQTLGTGIVLTGSNSQVTHANSARTVTITPGGSVLRTGAGSTSSFENLVNSGSIAVNGGTLFSSGTLANQGSGTIAVTNGATLSQTGSFSNNAGGLASVSGTGSKLAVANVSNSGSLLADLNGLLSLTGSFNTAGLGNVTVSNGGTVEFASSSTLNNTAANLTAPNGGSYLFNGTIVGGTVDPAALTQSAGILDAAMIMGNVTVPAGASLTLKNGGGFTGNATIGANGQNNGFLILGNDTTVSTALVFAGNNSQLTHSNSARTLTLTSTASLGRTGAGSTSSFENIQNSGAVTISGGTFFSSGAFTNKPGGTVSIASGATFSQSSAAFTQTGGSLAIDGTLNPGSLGLAIQGGVVSGSGTIGGNVTVSGGILSPGGANIGTLTLSNGTLAITNATAFVVDVGTASADKLAFQNPPSAISLGTGLLSISLNLLSQPTVGTTYNILQVTSGANGITGTLAGLPTSGMGFYATYQSTPYFFTVNYQSNLVSLTVTPVPEPSTWALLGTGLVIVGWQLRRRRK